MRLSEPRRLLLVEHEALIRVALHVLLDTVPTLKVVGDVGTAAEALTAAERLRPDLVLIDLKLPDGGGTHACHLLRGPFPALPILLLGGSDDEILQAISAGAAGYITRSSQFDHVLDAIQVVGHGGSYFSLPAAQQMLNRLSFGGQPPDAEERLARLSHPERQALILVAQGRTNREIGNLLGRSEHTIKGYVSGILFKLGVKRRSEAAAYIARLRSPLLAADDLSGA